MRLQTRWYSWSQSWHPVDMVNYHYFSKANIPIYLRFLGETLRDPRLGDKIVGGQSTTIQKYPYTLSLQQYGQHFCGASIITSIHALTAAHCVYE